MTTYDESLTRLSALVDEFSSGKHSSINEDTTRLRLVDVLLFECLDWNKYDDVVTENVTNVGIIDYALPEDGTLLVVEAKKTGISFKLPIEAGKGRLIRSVESILSLDKDIEKAMGQAVAYALDAGAPFVAVTNGWQIIAFCTQVGPGKSWRKGKALVFDSLLSMKTNFKDLWNALSASAVNKFTLQNTLSAQQQTHSCPRRAESIANFDRSKNRNDIQADLQILGDLVFGGRIFEDRKLFQEYCYCAGGAIPQFSRASRSYLEDRYPQFFASTANTPALEPAQTKKGPAAALTNLTNIKKPILLLGDVGVGKTTFLEHLFLVDWIDKKSDLIILRIDLADKPSRSEDLPNMVANEIERSLLEHYDIDINEDKFLRGCYHAELKRYAKSVEGVAYSPSHSNYAAGELKYITDLRGRFDQHLKSIFAHLVKARKKMVVLIFDNVDQRNADLQSATFIQAQIAASTWDIFVMVALRPETFVKAKLEGEISGYHPRAFTIAPPRFDQLIERRISTAIQMLRGKLPIPEIGSGASLQVANVSDYLEVLQHSFTKDPEMLAFCEDISGGNMRLALDYLIAFMSCGHVDAPKILEKWRNNGEYMIPIHEFTRGVMFSDREYYSSKDATISNVFSSGGSEKIDVFSIVDALGIASVAMNDTRTIAEGVGYIGIQDLKLRLVSVGYQHDQADRTIAQCMACRFLETNLKSGEVNGATHVRISPTGRYYHSTLIRTFVYIDAVCLDTPICDKKVFAKVTDVQTLPLRLARAEHFIDYLDACHMEHTMRHASSDWSSIATSIRADIARVRLKNENAAFRRTRS